MKTITNFDKYAQGYDSWFLENMNVLTSEVRLVARCLQDCEKILSVGCGSGLFESILRKDFSIYVEDGIEPSSGMAEIARKRGLNVQIATAESADFGLEKYDTILFNGTPSYITDLDLVVKKAHNALIPGGKVVMIDVPKESSYALMYNLAYTLGSWEHPLLAGAYPRSPYPIEFLKEANWRTTQEKIDFLKKHGFKDFKFAQTLTRHPVYTDEESEEPVEGYDKGDYVAICATK